MSIINKKEQEIREKFEKEWDKSNDWGGGAFGSLDETGDDRAEFTPNKNGILDFFLALRTTELEEIKKEIEGLKLIEASISSEGLARKQLHNLGVKNSIQIINNHIEG